jgi:C-terminal processing protease CtpA/Prc
MVGRLLDHALTYDRECFEHAHPLHLWLTGCGDLIAEPRGRWFDGRVAVLVDAGVVSSGEWLAAALCDTGRARCFGRATAGASGNPVQFGLPGGAVRYSTGNAVRLDGSPFERGGVPPHELVTWHRDDVLAGRDPDLEAALRWLAR